MNNGILSGKVAIVTGGGGGIGESYAWALAKAGARIAVADINQDSAKEVANSLVEKDYQAKAFHVDIGSTDSTSKLAEEVFGEFGSIDVLVNNAALMAELDHTSLADIPIDEFLRIQNINLVGALRCSQAVIPFMRAKKYGKIINQSSAAAFIGGQAYAVSKHGIVGLTAGLAKAVSSDGIRVNAIAPGVVTTPAGLVSSGEHKDILDKTVPFGSSGPAGLTGAIVFLASSESDWVTGQTLNVDGGWIMRL